MLVIWALGSVIIWRLRRFHITGIYVASFVAFAFMRSWMTGSPWQSEIAPITGPMYQLFIFFMITDPKTTVRSRRGQCVVVFLVALLEMVLRLYQIVYAPFYALFIVGPAAMLIEIWLDSCRANAAKAHGGAVMFGARDIQSLMPRRRIVCCLLAALLALSGCQQKQPSETKAAPVAQAPVPVPSAPQPAAPSSEATHDSFSPFRSHRIHGRNRPGGHSLQTQQRRIRKEISSRDHGQRRLLSRLRQ